MLNFFRKSLVTRFIISATVGLQLNMLAMGAWADAIANSYSQAQIVGAEARSGFSYEQAELSLQDVFPELGGDATAELSDVYGQDAKTIDLGSNSQGRLLTEESQEGEAYRTIVQSSQRATPDLKNDPMFNSADEIRDKDFMTSFRESFSDCSKTEAFEDGVRDAHIANYKTCERVNNHGGDVDFQHDYTVGIVEHISGQPNIQSCGDGCIYIWVGTVGDNYWSGSCRVFEEFTQFRVLNSEAITQATIDYVAFDDYFQIHFNDQEIWSHTPGVFPPETSGPCERGTNWRISPNKNITSAFTEGFDVITFKTRTSVTGLGEGYARIKILFDPSKAIKDNGWSPEDRLDMFDMINDGFCSEYTITCNAEPAGIDENGCTFINGIQVCNSDMYSPHAELGSLCRDASVTASCAFYEGQMDCYTDASGNEQCPVNGGETCGVTHDVEIESKSIKGKFAANGRVVATAELDFMNGTWETLQPSDGTQWSGSVDKVNLGDFCDDTVQVELVGAGLWPDHGLGGSVDTSIVHKVLENPSCSNGMKAKVEIRDTKSGSDLKYILTGDFNFRLSKIVRDIWTPQSCIKQGQAVLNGECETGTITVTKGTSAEGACGNIGGVHLCPGSALYESLSPSPLGTSRLAEQIRVEGCGVIESNRNTCTQYEEDASCGFVSQRCISGAEGASGTCYAYEDVWDCGYSVEYPTLVNTGTSIECPGGARCMGSECFDTSNTKSGDFAYAAAMLQVAQFAEHDIDCGGDGQDIEQSNECKVFPGEAMECKKALGGYVDCCEAPDGVSLFDYVNLTMQSLKMASAVKALSDTGSLYSPGYWQAAQSAAGAIGKDIITGQWNDIVNSATASWKNTLAGDAAEGVISEFKGYMMEKTYDIMVDMGAESAANAIFQPAQGAGTGMELTSQFATALNFIGMVYTAYVIADLMINIIWECEPKEFELGAKKETRQCTYVGSYCASEVLGSCVEKRESYCCFSSVVARIIQEQGKPQLGQNFGSAKTPSCGAMSINDMARIDWNQIDLTEWIGMLSMTGNLPTIDSVSLEQITGTGSALGDVFDDSPRLNTLDRNIERLEGLDIDELKKAAEIEAASKAPR